LFRLITTFDEVPPSPRYDRHGTACTAPHRPHRGIGVDLKRVPPKSRPTASAPGPIRRSNPRWKRPARTPPSTFLFLLIHLSNSPEPQGFHLFVTEEPSKLPPPTQRRGWPPTSVRCFAQARHRAERRRAVCGGYIGEGPEPCQPPSWQFFYRHEPSRIAGLCCVGRGWCGAPPHCSHNFHPSLTYGVCRILSPVLKGIFDPNASPRSALGTIRNGAGRAPAKRTYRLETQVVSGRDEGRSGGGGSRGWTAGTGERAF
jgi:hypothetical protein